MRTASVQSNLIDPEKMGEIYEMALRHAKTLQSKYYTVSTQWAPEDVAQRVMKKILKQNVCYDENKKKSLSNFVFMLVNCVYLDIVKKMKGEEGNVSTEEEICENKTVVDTLAAETNVEDDVIDKMLLSEVLESLPIESDKIGMTPDGVAGMSMRNIIKWKVVDGYSLTEISEWFGVKSSTISSIIKKSRPYVASVLF